MNKKTPGTESIHSEAAAVDGESGVMPGRRRVLQIMGTTAVAVPVLGLSACGGGDSGGDASSSAPAAPAKEAMQSMQSEVAEAGESMEAAAEDMADAAGEMADEMSDAAGEMAEDADAAADEATAAVEEKAGMIASDGMAQVDENGAQAMGLGYRHDATTVDASVQTRYKSGQQCSNCALYQGGDAAWGGCPLFAGQVVKSTGWCSAYAPAA